MKKFVLLDKDSAVINTVIYNSERFFKESNDIFDVLGGIPNNIVNLINSLEYDVDFLIPYDNGEDFVISHPQGFQQLLVEYGIYDDLDCIEGRLFGKIFPLLRDTALPAIFKEVLATGTSYYCKLMEYEGKKLVQSFDHIVVKYNNNLLLFLTKKETNFDLMFGDEDKDDIFYQSSVPIAIIQNNVIVKENNSFKSLLANINQIKDSNNLNITYFLSSNNFIFEDYTSEEVAKIFKDILERESYSSILTLRHKTEEGFLKWYTIQLIPVIYKNKPAVQIECEDISERKNTTLKALRLENDLKIIQQDGNLAMMHWDPVHQFEWTSGIYNIIAEEPGSIPPGKDILFKYLTTEPEENKRIHDLVNNAIETKGNVSTVTDLETKEGIKHVSISVHCYPPEGIDNLPSAVGYIQDITDVVKLEQEKKNLELTLDDRNLLLREMYQRFKGNLQVLLSYLNLDMRFNSNNPEKTIESTRARINALVLSHESMNQSPTLIEVNLKNYIQTLITSLLSLYQASNIHPKFDLDDSINCSVQKSISIGLMISELIIDTIKYAYPNNLEGTLNINLKKEDEKSIFIISNDGVGVNDEIQEKIALSVTIVNSLVDQLDGSLEVLEQQKGAGLKIIF